MILLLSFFPGSWEKHSSTLPRILEDLRRQLERPVRLPHSRGAEYLDQRLDNFSLCGDGVVVVDLEQVVFFRSIWRRNLNIVLIMGVWDLCCIYLMILGRGGICVFRRVFCREVL